MTLATPAALTLLLAIPVLLWLERWSRQRQTLVVPSLLLFRRLPTSTLESARLRQRQRQWLVWLECLALALIALGAATPRLVASDNRDSGPQSLDVAEDRSPPATQPPPPVLGISAVLHYPENRGDALFVRVVNRGDQPRRTRLLLHTASPAELESATHLPPRTTLEMEIAPHSERAAMLSDPTLTTTLVASVSLVPADGLADPLAPEDRVVCTRLPRRHLKAIIAGRPAPAVRRALDAAARGLGHRLTMVERPHWPADPRALPRADLLVLNEIEPLVHPRAPVVVAVRGLAPPSPSSAVAGSRASAADELPGLDLSGIRVARARHDPPPNLVPVLSSTPEDLVLVGARPSSRGEGLFVYVGFPVEDPVVTDWPLDASFPLLFAACVEVAAERQTGELKSWPAGTPLTEMARASLVDQALETLVVRFPKGHDRATQRLDATNLTAPVPGLYRFEDSSGRVLGLSGVGLLSPLDRLTPSNTLEDPAAVSPGSASGPPPPAPGHAPLALLMLCLSGAILAVTTVARLQTRPGVASAEAGLTQRPR